MHDTAPRRHAGAQAIRSNSGARPSPGSTRWCHPVEHTAQALWAHGSWLGRRSTQAAQKVIGMLTQRWSGALYRRPLVIIDGYRKGNELLVIACRNKATPLDMRGPHCLCRPHANIERSITALKPAIPILGAALR